VQMLQQPSAPQDIPLDIPEDAQSITVPDPRIQHTIDRLHETVTRLRAKLNAPVVTAGTNVAQLSRAPTVSLPRQGVKCVQVPAAQGPEYVRNLYTSWGLPEPIMTPAVTGTDATKAIMLSASLASVSTVLWSRQ